MFCYVMTALFGCTLSWCYQYLCWMLSNRMFAHAPPGTAGAAHTSKELRAGDALLHYHPSDRDHCQAAVIELLGLHGLQLLWIRGLQPKRRNPKSPAVWVGLI